MNCYNALFRIKVTSTMYTRIDHTGYKFKLLMEKGILIKLKHIRTEDNFMEMSCALSTRFAKVYIKKLCNANHELFQSNI